MNVVVVIYEPLPDDPTSGRIIQTSCGTDGSILAESRPWVEVAVYRMDYDRTHKVLAGQVVPIDAEASPLSSRTTQAAPIGRVLCHGAHQ
jgi:hypothetical protein